MFHMRQKVCQPNETHFIKQNKNKHQITKGKFPEKKTMDKPCDRI